MLHRHLAVVLHRVAHAGEPILVQGPRGAGKTTLLRREFPGHTYVSLDEATPRTRARSDPEAFLARLRGPAFVDDAHRAPELVAYLDARPGAPPVVLASSRRIRSSLTTLELYPPTTAERARRPPVSLEMLGRFVPASTPPPDRHPPWHPPRSFLDADVRDLVSVHDMDRFERFLHAAAQQSGEVLDQQALARACAVSHTTATRWLAVLDTCFVTLQLPPADPDFGRRLVRRPKLHFLDGGPFESQVVSELYRNARHMGESPDLRYWRDSNGMEIPLVVQPEAGAPVPVGIRRAPTPPDTATLKRWMALASVDRAALIAGHAPSAAARPVLRYSLAQL